jgi:opacity protein-like surface antigen
LIFKEDRMTRRASVLIAAAAATALVAVSVPAQAAMPVGTPQAGQSDLTLVQDQASGQKKSKKSKRQQEADKSIESGTVPKRYRSSVPKEYHHLIPFAK